MASTLNLGTVKTPGVYIDEMSLFPPSVAQVDTAIPAFIGPTRIAYKAGEPVRIGSMAEFRSFYGGGPDRALTVTLDNDNNVASVQPTAPAYLYDSLLLYFSNGGEKCYIVSTGTYDTAPAGSAPYIAALDALLKFDEPTLIAMPDAVRLLPGDLATVQQAALKHCRTMQDRFAILDVQMDATRRIPSSDEIKTTLSDFRTNVGNAYLNYGAAYYPYLQTTLSVPVSYASLTFRVNGAQKNLQEILADSAAIDLAVSLNALKYDVENVQYATRQLTASGGATQQNTVNQVIAELSSLTGIGEFSPDTDAAMGAFMSGLLHDNIVANNAANKSAEAFAQLSTFVAGFIGGLQARAKAQEAELVAKSPVYAGIVKAATAQGIILPPSGAVAGAYARTDADRGVWKSPANVSLSYVAGPVVALTDSEQESLNVDVVAGKSINAIRAFTGKGTLVWGGRTLAGSDNEWRYVAVRRFFLMAEESIKKATAQFVFEANDANTWVRVRAMIENFLTLQWRAGALAGVKAENAFFVRVGLGQTMTPQDVLNGFMIIEIGMAVVRPAEFIVLRFSHKMQEA